jgi:PAS domain S-box-containing protein
MKETGTTRPTKSKTAEVFRHRTEELEHFFNLSSDLFCIMDTNGYFRRLNPGWERILGYKRDELIGKRFFDLIHPDEIEQTQDIMKTGKEVFKFQNRIRCKDETFHWLEWGFSPDNKLIYAAAHDVTERKQAEEEVRKNEDLYRVTLQAIPDAVGILRVNDARFQYVNSGFFKTTGYLPVEVTGRTPFDLNLPVSTHDWVNFMNDVIGSRGVSKLSFQYRAKNGTVGDALISARPIRYRGENCVVMVMTDISALKKLEEEKSRLENKLALSQKMEALGTITGGIAHDLNNILTAIVGYAQLATIHTQDQSKVQKNLNDLIRVSNRAKDLISQILAFSRYNEVSYSPLILNTVVEESLNMLRSVIPRNIEIRRNINAAGLVMGDPTQIHQIIMNLTSNAVQAMGEMGGILEVELEEVRVDEPSANVLNLTPGPYFKLSVNDTGQGMTSDDLLRIFNPDFTTKGKDSGAGLGLYVVQMIVRKHKGAITCKSAPDKGATFEVYLPEIVSLEEAARPPSEEELLLAGTERIFFVDDEPDLVNLAEGALGSLGYKVTTTTSSINALKTFLVHSDQFDLVIIDMTMPDLTGDKLAQRIIGIRPDIPVILCTGYSEYISEEKAKQIGIREFIMKPFEMKDLAKAVRKVLDRNDVIPHGNEGE